MSKEQIMNKKLKQLHNINKAMQSALHPGIKQLWMDKFHQIVLNFAEQIRDRKPIEGDKQCQKMSKYNLVFY